MQSSLSQPPGKRIFLNTTNNNGKKYSLEGIADNLPKAIF
jgi:hypothetical protein